jgi:hypothetical protein
MYVGRGHIVLPTSMMLSHDDLADICESHEVFPSMGTSCVGLQQFLEGVLQGITISGDLSSRQSRP